jgi:hypothetical protein
MEEATNNRKRDILGKHFIVPKLVDWNRIVDREKIAPCGTISFGRLQELPVHLKMDTEKEFAARPFPVTVNSKIVT